MITEATLLTCMLLFFGLSAIGILFVALLVASSILLYVTVEALSKWNRRQQQQRRSFLLSLPEAHSGVVVSSPHSTKLTLCLPMGNAKSWLVENYKGGDYTDINTTDLIVETPTALPPFVMFLRRDRLSTWHLPQSLRVCKIGIHDFDKDFCIRGYPGVMAPLFSESVRTSVRMLQKTKSLQIIAKPKKDGGTQLHVRTTHQPKSADQDAFIRHVRQLLDALQDSTGQLWAATAERHQLSLAMADGLPQMSGLLNGVPVEIKVFRHHYTYRTLVTVRHSGPDGLHVVHANHKGLPATRIKTGNPVLDMSAQIYGDDVEGTLQMFSSEDSIAAILPIVHGYPGTAMTDQGTKLELPGWQTEAIPALMEKLDAFTAHLKLTPTREEPLPSRTGQRDALLVAPEAAAPPEPGRRRAQAKPARS